MYTCLFGYIRVYIFKRKDACLKSIYCLVKKMLRRREFNSDAMMVSWECIAGHRRNYTKRSSNLYFNYGSSLLCGGASA